MKILLPLIFGISLFSCGSKSNDKDLKEMILNGAFIVDVRTPQEFAEGSVYGAVNIPLQSIDGRLDEFKDKKGVVLYCKSGQRAGQAKTKLEKAGIKNVVNGKNMSTINNSLIK